MCNNEINRRTVQMSSFFIVQNLQKHHYRDTYVARKNVRSVTAIRNSQVDPVRENVGDKLGRSEG